MSVYAPIPAFAERKRHPRALLFIVAAHGLAIAAVMTAKMDLPNPFDPVVTRVELVPEPEVPPENPPPQQRTDPHESMVGRVPAIVPGPRPDVPAVDVMPIPTPGPGPVILPTPNIDSNVSPVRVGPRFITPEWDIKPPYPQQKLRLEEEAVLQLRLAIDERGRVTAVEPVGPADPVFLAAARRHLVSRWRYKPATEDGRAIATSTVITLRFRLED
jgi:protein TonB